MKQYYEAVSASEELPEDKERYLTSEGWATYHPLIKEWRKLISYPHYLEVHPEIWFRPIPELISEEEIEGICRANTSPGLQDGSTKWDEQVKRNRKVAKAIVNKLKKQ